VEKNDTAKNISAAIAVANILLLLSSDTYAHQLDTTFSLRHFGHLSCNNILNSLTVVTSLHFQTLYPNWPNFSFIFLFDLWQKK